MSMDLNIVFGGLPKISNSVQPLEILLNLLICIIAGPFLWDFCE